MGNIFASCFVSERGPLPNSFEMFRDRPLPVPPNYFVSQDVFHERKTFRRGRVDKKYKKTKICNSRVVPTCIQQDPRLLRFWHRRYSLFSRFDEGIQLDGESWYSVTPEAIAKKLANRIKCSRIVDAFCGCGGNTIQFAMSGKHVIAIDIDPEKILKAKHNARIYGVEDKITFYVGDFFHFYSTLSNLKVEAIFLSPPWGGLNYKSNFSYNIETQLQPKGATELFQFCRKITENIAIFLPKNTDRNQIQKLAIFGNKLEIESNYLGNSQIGITAFFGKLSRN